MGEDVAIEVHDTARPPRLGEKVKRLLRHLLGGGSVLRRPLPVHPAATVEIFAPPFTFLIAQLKAKQQNLLDARDMAIGQHRSENLTHHSDQGSQYTSIAFGTRCRRAGVWPSMGSVSDCDVNAMCGSFFATLECGCLTEPAAVPMVKRIAPTSSSSTDGTRLRGLIGCSMDAPPRRSLPRVPRHHRGMPRSWRQKCWGRENHHGIPANNCRQVVQQLRIT